MTVNRNCWWRIPICAGVLVLVFLALAPPAGPWKFRTHGGVYGTRGIAKVVYDRIMGDPAVPAGVKENLVWDVIRPGSVIPDKWRMEPYFLDSRHLMTYVENRGSEWLLEVDNLVSGNISASENISYYLGIASHYWADIFNYSHHDNARLYFENLYGEDAGYEIWDSYHDHLELQVEFYRPKDPALIVSPGAPAVDYSYVADEPDPLVDGSSRIGSGTGPANTQDSNYDGDNEQISEGNTAGPPDNTYVTSETVNEGGTTGISGAQDDDGTYENIYETDYGAPGGPENRAVDAKDSADDTGSTLADAQSDDGTTYEVPRGDTMHFDSINTSGAGGTLTQAMLHVKYSTDDGYTGPNFIRWSINEEALQDTNIQPSNTGDPANFVQASDNLLAVGVDTVAELESLDIEFFNDDPAAPDSVYFDYVWVEATWTGAPAYRENVQHNITGIPPATDNTLQIEYYTAGDSEAVSIYIYNFANNTWDNAGTLQGGTEASPNLFENNIDSDHISGGEVRVRYVQPDDDGTQTSLMVDYCRVITGTPDYRLTWEHRIPGVNPARDNYTLRIYGRNDTGDENVGVYIWDNLNSEWDFIDNLPLADGWITFFIPAENIDDYLDAGNNFRIRYFEDGSDTTQTTIFLDVVVLDENYVLATGDPYTDLDAFLQDARAEIRKFIDNTMPPNDPMGGWFGDWISSRKCEEDDYSVYANGNANGIHYGSKELVDMATELVYSGWIYALSDGTWYGSADRISWDQWWSRSHREPGVCYVGF